MKVLVCGDRYWNEMEPVLSRLRQLPKDSIIIEGEARGADSIAREAATLLGLEVRGYWPDWTRFGKAAGVLRNQQMLDSEHPDLVIAFHHNLAGSRGTVDMIRRAEKAGIPIECHG